MLLLCRDKKRTISALWEERNGGFLTFAHILYFVHVCAPESGFVSVEKVIKE